MGYNSKSFALFFSKISALLVVMSVGFWLAAMLVLRVTALEPAAPSPSKAAAIVLLAGAYEERSPVAASLYHAGFAPRILLTDDGVRRGWSPEHQRNLYAIERTEIELMKHGVPPEAIVRLPFRKSGTVYDALAVKDYAVRDRLGSIILVTSDYHIRRAYLVFRRVFEHIPTMICAASSRPARLTPSNFLEPVKLLYYIVRFGILGSVPA